MFCVMIDRVRCRGRFSGGRCIFPGVWVSVKTGKIAAADLETDPVSFTKEVAGRPQVECELVGLAGIQVRGLLRGVAITRPQNSLRQVLRESVRPNIDKLGSEISIHRGGTGK